MDYLVTNRVEEFEAIREDLEFSYLGVGDSLELLGGSDIIGYDSETTGLGFMDANLTALIFSTISGDVVTVDVAPDGDPIEIGSYKELIQTKKLVIQRSIFDIPFMYKHGIIPDKIYDTYLAEYNMSMGITTHKRDYGSLVKFYLGIELDKSRQKEIHKIGILNKVSLEYCFNDARYLIPIMMAQLPGIRALGIEEAVRLDNQFSRALAYIEFCGIYFDADKWDRVVRKVEYEEYGAWLKLNAWLEENTNVDPLEINWASPAQVKVLFKETLGIDVFNRKTKKESVAEKFIEKVKHPVIPIYIHYKHKAKSVSTYGRNWFDYPRSDGRIHTKFNPLVATGRTSSGNVRSGPFPNLQNIPHEALMRSPFIPRGQKVFLNLDFSSQEGVIMADKSKDPSLLEFYKSGKGDFHSYVAKKIWPKELGDLSLEEIKAKHPDLRSLAKQAGFAIIFGGNGYTIADNLNVPVEVGERVYNGFFKAFPTLSKYFDKVSKEALRKGYILCNTITGRRRYLENYEYYKVNKFKQNVSKYEGEVYRLALNTPVQATAADITKKAGTKIFEWILANKRFGKTLIVNMVHDEYVISEHTRKAEETAPILQKIMEDVATEFLDELTMKAEPVIAKVWTH